VTEVDAHHWGDAGEDEPQPELEDLYDEMTLRRLGLWSDELAREWTTDERDWWSTPSTPYHPSTPSPPSQGRVLDGVDELPEPGPWDDEWDGEPVGESGRESVGEHLGEAPTPARRARHVGLAGAMLAGAMLGLGDVLEPEKRKDAVIEPELLGEPATDQPVQFIMVPGLPKASVVILRPWLRR
jgi:hypothetical protein